MTPEPVVVTGVGLVNPLGNSASEVFSRLRRGDLAGKRPERFDSTGFSCHVCAQVEGFDPEALLGDAKTLRLMNHDAVYAVAAARLALRDANVLIGRDYPPEQTALYGATGLAGIAIQEVSPLIRYSADDNGVFDARIFGRAALNKVRPTLSFKILSNMPICFISIFENIQGPNAVYNPWEGQGSEAILAGMRSLQSGKAKCALVGGCDVKAHELAFVSLQQQGIFRSFETSGKGCIPGEGGAFLFLELESGARARGAKIYACLSGFASATSLPTGSFDTFRTLTAKALENVAESAVQTIISSQDGNPLFENLEEAALANFPTANRVFPKKQFGNLFAAASPAQLAVGAMIVYSDGGPALVNSFGYGSQQTAFLLTPAERSTQINGNTTNAEPLGRTTLVNIVQEIPEVPEVPEVLEVPEVPDVPEVPNMPRRVVVTGLGIVSPVGKGFPEFWRNLLAGRSGTGRISLFDASGLLVSIGGEVKNFDSVKIRKIFPAAKAERDRKILLGLAAAGEALLDAGLDSPAERMKLAHTAVHVGVSLEVFFLEDVTPLARTGLEKGAIARHLLADPTRPSLQTPLDRLAELIGDYFGFFGTRSTNCSACAAGAMAVGEAFWEIRDGRCDLALAGAADSILNPLGMGGFTLLRALTMTADDPKSACRPFDASRDGTVLGEGGAFLVLESLDHAISRRAKIYAEVLGYGSSLDAFRVSDPEPSGRGAVLSMRNALADSGLSPSAIDCVNAHGTGTPKNDAVETHAIKEVLGAHAREIPVHAVKSMTGHMIAASGAAEALTAALTLYARKVPPTINLTTPDPDCDLDYVSSGARPFNGSTVLSNSFAFGGQNATLIFGRYKQGDRP